MTVRKVQLLMYLMIALLVAVMMKVMGVILIAAMLVIPTSGARLLSRTPEQMVIFSLVFGLAALVGGVFTSFRLDWQTGSSIVLCATALLLLTLLIYWQFLTATRIVIKPKSFYCYHKRPRKENIKK